ncbi:MAG: hypothetical protein J6Y85_05360 [Alphaproteobacteria bacterium]|nr:hypothetical protein [Alphaproteobacteria bacterium]
MTDESVKRILSAPIVLLRESNGEERGLFHNKKGWLYTIGLESGQSFVAHIAKGKEAVFTLRPLNNLVPQLTQVRWEQRPVLGYLPPFATFCETTPETSEMEKALFADIFEPVFETLPKKHPWPWTATGYRFHYPKIWASLHKIWRQLSENKRIQQQYRRALHDGYRKLQGLMIPCDTHSTNQMTQDLINERRQNG